MNTAVVSHERLLAFVDMLVRYGAVKITIISGSLVSTDWTVKWKNGK